jgi:ribonucleoside-triphosphate reductase (thioredoxin)
VLEVSTVLAKEPVIIPFSRPRETQIINGEWVLGEEFISQYRGKQPRWGFDGLGWVVYIRTYARTKEDGTLEQWWETCERVTLGNFNLKLIDGKIDPTATKEEVERFYHLFFNLAISPPGRGLWMSGTEYAKTNGDALNNCWYTDVVPQARRKGEPIKYSTPFVFVFDQAMKGGGVGAGVYKENIAQFPVTHNQVKLVFVVKEDHGDVAELKQNGIEFITPEKFRKIKRYLNRSKKNDYLYIKVPDSREGWADYALANVIDAHYKEYSVRTIYLDLSDVRHRGTKIKRFGGTASGIAPLCRGLLQINSILNRSARQKRRIKTVEAGDIIQIIGTVVVAGNVRRTAIILLGSEDDQEFIESKDYSKMGLEPSQWRWASNNSIVIDTKTPRERLYQAAQSIFYNGEPGVVNLEVTRHFGRIIDGRIENIDGEANGTNPCGEISLSDKEPCNLFEINMPRCMELGGISVLEEACYLGARYTYRVTFMPYEWDKSRETIQKNRRLGVGLTGYADYTLLHHDGNYQDTAPVLDRLYKVVRQTNNEHAKALGTQPSIKVTTVKPSGSISKLMGVSAGQHDHWDRYYIQRIRIAADAPIMDLIYKAGYPVEPMILGRKDDGTVVYDYNTVVVEFPMKAPTADHPKFRSSREIPLMEQAERQAILQTYWSDNAVSATLTFHKPSPENGLTDEQVIEEITEVLDRFKGVFKSTSLLPHATGTYDQMPWESITKEEYEARIAKLKGRPWDYIDGGLKGIIEDDLDSDCVGGACPIR